MTENPVFYYRNGCHLCEELAAVLFRGWPAQASAMEWRDVDTDAQWQRLYGNRVPVLCQGEAVVCDLQPDLERISQYFGEMANPL
ncbi:glutaredoxin family protein [Thiosocius teredinicola]|uniref:glutaredoxin family protein n=1 Tax=Thiosocius teredinicola TaxID=1973002 RepID=UPI0009911F5C